MLFSRLFTDKDKYFDSQGFNIRGVRAHAFLRHLLCNLYYPTACLGSCIMYDYICKPPNGWTPLSSLSHIWSLSWKVSRHNAGCSDYFAELAKGWWWSMHMNTLVLSAFLFHQRMQLPTPKRNVILVYIVWDLLRCTTVGLPTAAYCLSLVSFPDSNREGSLNGTK